MSCTDLKSLEILRTALPLHSPTYNMVLPFAIKVKFVLSSTVNYVFYKR
jgi:hypothetical protein